MKDLNISRKINVTALGTLLVSVTACGVSTNSVAKAKCDQIEKCKLEDFNEKYTSMDNCIIKEEDELEDEWDKLSKSDGEECADADLDLVDCRERAKEDECKNEDKDKECEFEKDQRDDLCNDEYY